MWCDGVARPQRRAASARPAQRSEAEPRALRCGGAGMQEGLPAEVELPSLSEFFRGFQMFSPKYAAIP